MLKIRNIKTISVFFTLILLVSMDVSANMASPWAAGSPLGEAYSSRDVDILDEHLSIEFVSMDSARIKVVYHILASRSGRQIPLVFDTDNSISDADETFCVRLDGASVPVQQLPEYMETASDSSLFASLHGSILYSRDEYDSALRGCRYFEVDLPEGEHQIEVEYMARAGYMSGEFIAKPTFRYNLFPAKLWRSFGGLDLEITVDERIAGECYLLMPYDSEKPARAEEQLDSLFRTAFPQTSDEAVYEARERGNRVRIDKVLRYYFDEFPCKELTIEWEPQVNKKAKVMMTIGPFGFGMIAFVLLACLNVLWLRLYRRYCPDSKITWPYWVGVPLVPLISFFAYYFSYGMIDSAIEKYASYYHGYTFFVFFLYPLAIPLYWLILWPLDSKRKENHFKIWMIVLSIIVLLAFAPSLIRCFFL